MLKRPVHILVLAAMTLEVASLKKRYAHAASVDFLVTGVGATRMANRLAQYLDHAPHRVDHVLHVGVSGGLDPGLKVGQAMHVGRVLRAGCAPLTLSDAFHTLLTTDQLADSLHAKQALFEQHHAHAVDMETYDVAQGLVDRGIAYTSVRAISDAAGTALPPQLAQWINDAGMPNPWAVMRYLISHPHKLPMLLKLQRSTQQATEALTQAAISLIERLRDEA